ncbi:MAG: DNA-processing protein DprA [Gammaproteobacteria bacterium]|nr:DNA-processing protein DprA [Gammaproteobacteria bacterium]
MAVTPVPTESADTLIDWLALCHAPGAGTATIHRLLDSFSGPASALRASNGQLLQLGLKQPTIDALRRPDERLIARDLEWREGPDNHIITCHDPAYPALLLQLPDPPPLLYIHGNVGLLSEPQLAMVGSRNPSGSGQQTAVDFARHLASAGLVITSGLALGIDAACHQGALDVNAPTIAVMGTGLDQVYPARHRELAQKIAEQGSLVSEFPIGTAPKPGNFPQRNRIISGLSLGTLVVEAAIRSGSLISARYALEQGREVFAIPGSIHNPLARGCHYLIREGAKLVETAQDIIDELGSLAGACTPLPATVEETTRPHQLDEEYLQFLDSIDFDPTSVDQLVERSGLTPAEVSSMLLQLELSGYIASSPGGLYNRLKNKG